MTDSVDSVGIEPLDFRAKEACTHYISPPKFTFNIFFNFLKTFMPKARLELARSLRPADFKSAVYTIPPPGLSDDLLNPPIKGDNYLLS